jgi:hypothetical protein
MVQIGCRYPLGKQDAFLERVRGFEARGAPVGWRQQLGLFYPLAPRRKHLAFRSGVGGVVHVAVAADLWSLDTSGLGRT